MTIFSQENVSRCPSCKILHPIIQFWLFSDLRRRKGGLLPKFNKTQQIVANSALLSYWIKNMSIFAKNG